MDILFIDTCLWIRLLEKQKFEEIFQKIDQLVAGNKIQLAVPDQLMIEFERNKDKIVKSRITNLKNSIKNLRKFDAILTVDQKPDLEECLQNYEANLGKIQAEHDVLIQLSEKILNSKNAITIELTEDIISNAANRAINKKWPFHKNKNSIGDAILYESIVKYKATNTKPVLYFVTDNHHDFSDKDNILMPHSEITQPFDDLNIRYTIKLTEIIEELTESHLSEDVKNSYNEYLGHILILGQTPPFKCPDCETELIYKGYNVRNGVAGSNWACNDCNTIYLDIDENY